MESLEGDRDVNCFPLGGVCFGVNGMTSRVAAWEDTGKV